MAFSLILSLCASGNTSAVCGDVNGFGGVTIGDLSSLIDYLLGGAAPPSTTDANVDGNRSITNNDAEALMAYLSIGGILNCAPIVPNTPFPASSDTVEFRNVVAPAGQSNWTVEVWLKATNSYYGLAVPFSFTCATSAVTLSSVTNLPVSGQYRIDNGLGKGLILLNITFGGPYAAGEARIASLNFSLGSTGQDNLIELGTTDYTPSNIVVISKWETGSMNGYTPVITDDRPSAGSISLDRVGGEVAPGVIGSGPVVFRLRATVGPTSVIGVSNGFRIYSPDGATWGVPVGDTLDNFPSRFSVLHAINYCSADGALADTVGFLGASDQLDDPGWPDGYDEVVFTITINTNALDSGMTICLDSSWFRSAGTWLWSLDGLTEAYPTWDGPHCFMISPTPTDPDGDGVLIGMDNCPSAYNPGQEDDDDDGIGNVCDATPQGGLIAHWALDDPTNTTAVDSSGNGLHGVPTGVTVVAGVLGSARSFDGIDDYIEVPDDRLLDITGSITISMWVKLDPGATEGYLLSKRMEGVDTINYGVKYWAPSEVDTLMFQYGSGTFTGSSYCLFNAPNLNDGNWHHLAVANIFGTPSSACWVVDGKRMIGVWRLWDGSDGGGTEIPSANDYPLEIGRQLPNLSYVAGVIDDIRIYNMALSEVLMAQIFLDGGGCAAIGSADSDSDNICDRIDNCPSVANSNQADSDLNGIGDACQADLTPVAADSAEVVEILTADLDMDTYTDVVFAGEIEAGLFVAWGQAGNPPVGDPVQVAAISNAGLEIFHLNNDTLPDVVAATNAWVYSLLNNGDGTFDLDSVSFTGAYAKGPGRASALTYGSFPDVAVGFFDSDIYPDVAVSPDRWFPGDGTGSFSGPVLPGVTFSAAAVADFNDDGVDDLALIEGDSITVYANSGAGSFTKADAVYVGLTDFNYASVTADVDLNADGLVDAVAAVATSEMTDSTVATAVLGDGMGGLTLADRVEVAGVAPQVAVSDVDRDFALDLVLSDAAGGLLHVTYNDGTGAFAGDEIREVGAPDALYFALASADLDRNGQPDFVSGSASGDNIILSLNDLPDEPVLPDEMFVTGYDYVDVSVRNPLGFVISRSLQSVAGSAYYRLLADADNLLDVRTYDYNLLLGLYEVTGRVSPVIPADSTWSMGIGIDGSQMATVTWNYDWPPSKKALSPDQGELFEFYYEMESAPTMRPFNGIPTDYRLPTFQWKLRVQDDPEGTVYRFQLDEYHDFSTSLRAEASDLHMPQRTINLPLGLDSVYYWRYLTSTDGGTTYADTSLTFAVYITNNCCMGRVGDANGTYIDEPTIGDVSTVIDHLFISGDPLQCYREGDINRSGILHSTPADITIGDVSTLIDYLFITGPSLGLPSCY